MKEEHKSSVLELNAQHDLRSTKSASRLQNKSDQLCPCLAFWATHCV